MKQALDQITSYLLKYDAYVLEILQPGISEAEIKTQIDKIGINLPLSVYDLYKWRNGIRDIYENNFSRQIFFDFGIFFSLESAIDLYKSDSIENKYWSRSYFPVFTNGGGDFLLLNIDELSGEWGMIYLFSPAINLSIDPVSIYDSIEAMVDSILLCYNKGAYFFENRELLIDTNLEFEICEQRNPRSLYWKDDESNF
ncbi:SMI1/KNR4 family protein [Chitinophaga sp. CB10]|uniref:SMI1/KNR4 family protein n=1 Tax=Chitinophaga sp. CB10 TaxID=1891659 RepID=UPI0025C4E448|nr:SMI1/KNR4 family protein [Chitinophaga sp. CB10]